MRTLTGTLLVALTLVGGPAMAQQHPWVPSGEPAYNQSTAAPAVQHPWVPSAYAGAATLPNDESARAEGHVRDAAPRRQRPSVSGN